MRLTPLLSRLNARRQLLQQGVFLGAGDRPASFWANLSLRLWERDRLDAAFVAFLRAARTDPHQDWSGMFQLWRVVQQRRDDPDFTWGEAAIATFSELAEQYPGDRACALNLAEALSRSGQPDAARPWYRRACQNRLDGDRPDLANLPKLHHRPPAFIGIGVMKCGTTALERYLSQHPNIFPTARKEIDFWSWKYPRGLDWYLAHFPELPDDTYLSGDISPTYFQHRQAPERLAATYPDIKLVVMLRDPVDRTLSHYHHACRHHVETRPLLDALRSHRQQLDRGENHPDKLNNYFASSLYAPALQRWLHHFPRHQLHLIFSHDLFESPQPTLDRLYDFLGLPRVPLDAPANPNPGGYSPAEASLRRELHDYFRPHNQQLAELLDTPLPF